jgi:hypothetical protein
MFLFGTLNHTLEIPNPKSQTPNPNFEKLPAWNWDLELGIWDLGFA